MKKMRVLASAGARRNSMVAAAACGAVSALGLFGVASVAKADYFWSGTNADYNTNNWTHFDYNATPNTATVGVGAPQGTGNDFNTLVGTVYGDPTSTTGAMITLPGGVITVLPTDPAWQVNDLRLGTANGTSGTIVQSGSSVSVNGGLLLGELTGASGTYNMSGGTLSVGTGPSPINSRTNVGQNGGIGVMNITGGTFNQGNSHFSISDNDGANGGMGTVNLSNALLYANQNEFWVGNGGTGDNSSAANYENGILNVSSGGSLVVGSWLVAGRFGGHGTINMTGNAVITKTNAAGGNTQWAVGDGAVAVINMTDQSVMNLATEVDMSVNTGAGASSVWNISGQAVVNNSGLLEMTDNTNSKATINISGNAQWNQGSPDIQIGERGTGTINISGGSLTMGGWLAVGRDGGNGTLNITGGTVTKSDGSGGNVTFDGNSGAINQTGGVFHNTTSETWLGERNSDNGVYNISGGTAQLGLLAVGQGGSSGTLLVSGTAQVNATTVVVGRSNGVKGTVNMTGGQISTGAFTRGSSTGTVAVNLSGGTLQATGDSTTFISGFKSGELNVNGVTIDSNNHAIGIASPLTGTGGFTKAGAGVLTLSSNSNTYSGTTLIKTGTLRIAAPTVVTGSIPAGSVQGYYSFESSDPNAIFLDATSNHNDLSPNAGPTGAPVGTAAPSTNAPPSGPTTGTHTGSLSLSGNAALSTQNFQGLPTGNSAYTIGAWIDITGTNGGIVGWGNYGTNNSVVAFRTNSSNTGAAGTTNDQLQNYWWADDLNASTGIGSITGSWHYVAVTYDPTLGASGTRTMYIDGKQIGQDNPGVNTSTNVNFNVGETDTLNPEFFTGNMADLLIANQAFNVAQLMAAEQNDSSGTFSVTTAPAGNASPNSPIQIASGAIFDVNSTTTTIGGLSGVAGSSVTLGSGLLTVNSTAASTYSGSITGTGGLIVGGTAPLTLATAPASTGPVTVGGKLLIAPSAGTSPTAQTFIGSVNISAGGTLGLSNASSAAARTVAVFSGGLTIANGSSPATGGTLDLGKNDAIVPAGSLSVLTAAVASGYNLTGGANWSGAGITSSAAAADSRHLTAVGIVQNNQSGTALFPTTFDGVTVGASSILLRYTYFGDANLDGKVDGSDYSLIDAGYSAHKTGWYNGDFNYDGVVDGSDYTLLDNAFNNQGLTLTSAALVATSSAQVAGPGSAAVPEPASIALLAIGAAGLFGRRRRSN